MKVSEYLAAIVIEATDLVSQGGSIRPLFEVLESSRGLLPYDAQLDLHASSINELSFAATIHYGDGLLPFLIVVRPGFLGFDITVVGIKDTELQQHIVMNFLLRLTRRLGWRMIEMLSAPGSKLFPHFIGKRRTLGLFLRRCSLVGKATAL